KLIVGYDTTAFDFARAVSSAVGVPDLARWHEWCTPEEETPGFGNQASELHQRLYDTGPAFEDLYQRFVATTVTELVGEPVRYQNVPNWRIQLPGRHGVGSYHQDRMGGHNSAEITFWVPLTDVTEENTLWVESAEGRGDYRPAVMPYGRMLVFDSADLMHGNVRNGSERTRVSFDFRVIPESVYDTGLNTPHHTGIDGPLQWLAA
ncbi:hypothetical protein, partial [Streptomyces sp. NPDC048845]|uniref:hypothetical protein n=1 Tax=Streptomyces sp. NPDC048845 TaxID=3155390 RepID=UPI00342F0DA9